MDVLVTYASRHGATRGIADRIADRLRSDGLAAELAPVDAAPDASRFDALVIGSAVYRGRWCEEARAFVRAWAPRLRGRPVWLFSSGPLGDEPLDEHGRDLRETAAPGEATRLVAMVEARDHRVFFGALNPDDLSIAARTARWLPPVRRRLAEGDFRDWDAIEAWADGIAAYLTTRSAPETVGAG